MKKGIKYSIGVVALLIVAYNSVYFKKLNEVKASANAKTFDAVAYADVYLHKKLPAIADKAITFDALLDQLKTGPAAAFDKYSHALSIGSVGFFLVKGEGDIMKMDQNDVYLTTGPAHNTLKIATVFIFGNAVRDASGLIRINDLASTGDLNSVSAEIDNTIRESVIPPFKAAAKPGDHVVFTGAITLNRSHLDLENIELIPVSLKIIK